MTENMKAFMDAIENNDKLKSKFDEISDKEQKEQKDYNDEYIGLAKECGITLTKDDFELDEEELSDEDLENVSGGFPAGGGFLLEMRRAQRYREKKLKSAQESSGQGTETTEDQN